MLVTVTGRRVLLTGASGGLATTSQKLAANAGARGHLLSRSRPAAGPARCRAVNHDVAAADGPFHLVLESTGGKNLPLALDGLVPRGTLVWFDQASRSPATLSLFEIRDGPGSVTICQFSYYDFGTPYGEDLAVLLRLVANGRLHPEIGRVAHWSETAATLTGLYQRRIRGNAVLTVS